MFVRALLLTVAVAGCIDPGEVERLKQNQAVLIERAQRVERALDQRLAVAPKPRAGALMDPSAPVAQAPERFTVRFVTTKGDILVDVHRAWAPIGVDRLYHLVAIGFYRDIAIFRAIEGFVAQFGIHGDPKISKAWKSAQIQDDKVSYSNKAGTLVFAKAGPNSRTTQLYFNLKDNTNLDRMGFAPLGQARSMDVLSTIYTGYGEGGPRGKGPSQAELQIQGNAALEGRFEKIDFVLRAELLPAE